MIETIRNELLVLAEPTYQRFAMRLLPGTDHLLGVRLPKLRQMARKIFKRDYEAYLQNNDELYFEEIMLKGMIIGYIKVPLDAKLELIRQFVPKINNWSVCDSFCSGLKFTKDHQMEVCGLLAFCQSRGWPVEFFTAEQLRQAPGSFTPSAFVQSVTGVDNVCERAAVLAAGGPLFFHKFARTGVTFALAARPFSPDWRWQHV